MKVTDFHKSSKKLPNHPTKAHVKFKSHRISFDVGLRPSKGFSRTRGGVYPLYTLSPYTLVEGAYGEHVFRVCADTLV